MYEADGLVHLMDAKTLAETSVPSALIGSNLRQLLEGGMEVRVRAVVDGPPCLVYANKTVRVTVGRVLDSRDGGFPVPKPATPILLAAASQ